MRKFFTLLAALTLAFAAAAQEGASKRAFSYHRTCARLAISPTYEAI
ncbi:MAG: hypothetical protein IJB39_00255 [Alistipes sp.]|nr:hypothetical protein [Alistipes sp.]